MSEQRLIDANALINALNVFSDVVHGNKHFLHGIASAKEIVQECETIEAVPVVLGKWTDTYKSGYHPQNCDICSICDCWSPRKSAFCPNCGAEMDI